MQTIAIANQKGGVGKTTVVVNLAAGLARQGKRVLVVDMDTQANATMSLGVQPTEQDSTVAHVLVDKARLEDVIRSTQTPGVDVAPATEDLASADLSLVNKTARETRLSRALNSLSGRYDVALIDTSPYLGLLTVNAIVAARHVIVPVSAEFLPMVGLRALGQMLDEVKSSMSLPVEVLGYVVTMFDKRLGLTGDAVAQLRERFGNLVFKTHVRVNANFKVAPSHGRDIFQLEKATKKPWKGIEDFEALTHEVLARMASASAAAA